MRILARCPQTRHSTSLSAFGEVAFPILYLEDPLGRNSCLFREERLFPSWGGNQLFAAEMFLLPRIFPFRNPVRQRLHILEELNIFVVYIGHFCLERSPQ